MVRRRSVIACGAVVGGLWFLEGTISLDRKLWLQHVRNGLGIGGRIADLPNPDGSGTHIQVPTDQVRRYASRSYQIVSRRFEESVFLGLLLAIGGTVTSAFFPCQSGRLATEDQTFAERCWLPSKLWQSRLARLGRENEFPEHFFCLFVFEEFLKRPDHMRVLGSTWRAVL
jgi:hypothetical protein